jgi:hypothetical protein
MLSIAAKEFINNSFFLGSNNEFGAKTTNRKIKN